ncbi:uncharacterized protein LOC130274559 [Hyla sarda]|uniref:uncharacterized protein LOC130274559 n=1 Tax=Hyla sarda TaxID=327740 RepID=UPI0024C3E940|nr:uncharacterized protein LOC130274559 [Hyla sarda]
MAMLSPTGSPLGPYADSPPAFPAVLSAFLPPPSTLQAQLVAKPPSPQWSTASSWDGTPAPAVTSPAKSAMAAFPPASVSPCKRPSSPSPPCHLFTPVPLASASSLDVTPPLLRSQPHTSKLGHHAVDLCQLSSSCDMAVPQAVDASAPITLADLQSLLHSLPTKVDISNLTVQVVDKCKQDFAQLSTELSSLSARVDAVEATQDSTLSSLQALQSVVSSNLDQMFYFQQHLDDIENQSRRNNIRIRGLPEAVSSG